jgi:sensor c-di-GMP phosphodiesterase-like protein
MTLRRPSIAQASLIAASLIAFVAGGHFAATWAIDHQRAKQLQELTEVALRRSEVAVDFGVATLDDVTQRGAVSCDPAALQTIRLQVYQRSAVKDIRLVTRDGSVVCSAYSETLEFDNGFVERRDMLPARDPNLLLFRVDQINGLALGVLKDVSAQHALIAILSINSYLLDILPAELRHASEVVLDLDNGLNVGRFPKLMRKGPETPIEFTKASTRYPMRVKVSIDRSAFGRWNSEAYVPGMLLAGVLGLAFGVLLARAVASPGGPIADLDRALARSEFKPYFQPIFDLRSNAIIGCEVLARWVHADGSVIPPMNFIPLAESSGRIEPMTWQILTTALHELQPRLKRDKTFKMSLNVVPRHLLSDGFIDTLREIVAEAKVSPRQIILEVTERDEMPDLQKASMIVGQLHDYGFRIAIDDVGVGHSGLSQIKGLGAHTMKIDKYFVDTITLDTSAVTIVEMLVRLAIELRMTVVAEGIETADQVSALLNCGVEQGQGYLVSPPLPFAKFEQLLQARQTANTVGSAGRVMPQVA